MNIFEITVFGITIAPSYYGLMYALGFIGGYYIIKRRIKISPFSSPLLRGISKGQANIMDDLFIYIVLGVVLGGRLGYVLFYDLANYLSSPLDILKVWEGGMSFHGGVIGVIVAMILFSRRFNINFYKLSDEVTAVLPIGLGLGRVGNYINKELLGYSGYNGPFAVDGRFPSPLLEALLEGLVLFIILNIVYKYKKFNGQIGALFLIFYGIFRLFVEVFFREPDSHLGYVFLNLSMGSLLSIPMILAGIYFYIRLSKKW